MRPLTRTLAALLFPVAAALAALAAPAFLGCAEPLPPPAAPPPAAPPVPAVEAPIEPLGPGCEEAKSKYLEEAGDHRAPAGTSDALPYAEMLNKGTFLDTCHVPPSVGVSICAAVREGHAVGVTVTTAPPDDRMIGCIAARIRALSFPSRPGMDIARTRFAPN